MRSTNGTARATTQVSRNRSSTAIRLLSVELEYKEAFALFDKKGTGSVRKEALGDLLRALGQNPTQAEVSDIISKAPRDGTLASFLELRCPHKIISTVDYKTFLTILNRPDGFKPAGTPGMSPRFVCFEISQLMLWQRSSFVASRCLIKKETASLVLVNCDTCSHSWERR